MKIITLILFLSSPGPSEALPYAQVKIPVSKDFDISGYLFKPTTKNKSYPAVVALHGCAGLTATSGALRPRELDWARRLTEWGFWVVFPDSFSSRGITSTCTRKGFSNFAMNERPSDAYAALSWLQKQTEIRPEDIVLMGWSNGGHSLLWAIDKNFKGRPSDLKHDFNQAIAIYPGCGLVAKESKWKTSIPLQILIGELDNWTPASHCRAVAEKQTHPKVGFTVFPGAHHNFDVPGLQRTTLKNLGHSYGPGNSAILETNEPARAKAITIIKNLLNPLMTTERAGPRSR